MASAYQDLKEARAKVKLLEAKISFCHHNFMSSCTEPTTFRTSRYSSMDGIEVEGPEIYGLRRYQTCLTCGLHQKSESKVPGEWSKWEDA